MNFILYETTTTHPASLRKAFFDSILITYIKDLLGILILASLILVMTLLLTQKIEPMKLASQEIEDNSRNILLTINSIGDLDELECIADSGHEVCAPTLEAPTQLSQDLENILQRFLPPEDFDHNNHQLIVVYIGLQSAVASL